MGEEIVGAGPRIKFAATRIGQLKLPAPVPAPLVQLSALMQRLEACGMVPILDDGLVGGNCSIHASTACGSSALEHGAPPSSTEPGTAPTEVHGCPAHACGGIDVGEQLPAPAAGPPAWTGGGILISRSGKQPHAPLLGPDWVLLTSFDAARWAAQFASADAAACPSSDAPLHAAALRPDAMQRYGWAEAPCVAVHGHGLAAGASLERARQAGFPISDHETLFSTPEDLAALEALFRSHPYPAHRCYIRRGHGFTLLAASVAEAERYLEQDILPLGGGAQHAATAAK